MGTYITQDHLLGVMTEDDLVQLTDDDAVGAVDTTVLALCIARAEGEFHSYAARRYSVPVDVAGSTTLAETIRGRLVDLAAFYLRSRRPGMPPEVRQRYDDAVRWLRDLADGKITLGATPDPAASGPGAADVRSGGETRQMTHDKLSGL